MLNPGLDEAQAVFKTVGRDINNHRYVDDTIFMEESKEVLKRLLTEVKECKSQLKTQHSKNEDHSIWSYHSMANR